jgi:hypothetical protein
VVVSSASQHTKHTSAKTAMWYTVRQTIEAQISPSHAAFEGRGPGSGLLLGWKRHSLLTFPSFWSTASPSAILLLDADAVNRANLTAPNPDVQRAPQGTPFFIGHRELWVEISVVGFSILRPPLLTLVPPLTQPGMSHS